MVNRLHGAVTTSASSGATSFDRALALEAAGEGAFRTEIEPGWDIRGTPHGGFLLSLVASAACRVAPQPDPVSVSANYLAPPAFGPAELSVEVVRSGRRQTTVAVRLVQEELERVRAVITVGSLPDAATRVWSDDVRAPAIPHPDDSIAVEHLDAIIGEDGIALHQNLELRFHPGTGWIRGAPTGSPSVEGWLRLVDGRSPDPLALLMFSDGFPPSMFEVTGRDVGHVPTVQLTTHLFAKPSPGWIQGRFRTRAQGGGFVDEDGELWDTGGNLVATTRQLALVR